MQGFPWIGHSSWRLGAGVGGGWEGERRGGEGGIKGGTQQEFLIIVQELCESRGGRPGQSVLTSLLVSVDVKLY